MTNRSKLRETIMTIIYQITLYKKNNMEYNVDDVIKENLEKLFALGIIHRKPDLISSLYCSIFLKSIQIYLLRIKIAGKIPLLLSGYFHYRNVEHIVFCCNTIRHFTNFEDWQT